MKPILMAPRMAIALRNTKIDSWPEEPIDQTKPYKWQTRRAMNPQPYQRGVWDVDLKGHLVIENADGDFVRPECPYGRSGDKLYVKENFKYHDWTDDGTPYLEYIGGDVILKEPDSDEWAMKLYHDVWADLSDPDNYAIDGRAADRKWRPSLFMPRWASRTHLKLEGIRIERLRDISESDAIAEGFESRDEFFRYYAERNKKSPDENPWVWVLEFRRIA